MGYQVVNRSRRARRCGGSRGGVVRARLRLREYLTVAAGTPGSILAAWQPAATWQRCRFLRTFPFRVSIRSIPSAPDCPPCRFGPARQGRTPGACATGAKWRRLDQLRSSSEVTSRQGHRARRARRLNRRSGQAIPKRPVLSLIQALSRSSSPYRVRVSRLISARAPAINL